MFIEQQTFDIDLLLHALEVENAPAWEGAPLHFTVSYHAPAELDAAFNHWKFLNGSFGCIPKSGMWNRSIFDPTTAMADHDLAVFTADTRCHDLSHRRSASEDPCPCVGSYLDQVICERCSWHAIGTESDVVEAWHDHAWPGWRDIPIVPEGVTPGTPKFTTWAEAHIPARFRAEGAPIRTHRTLYGTRNVPGGSPWGGYDLAAPAAPSLF